MALPRIEAVITADTKQAEAGFDRVERGIESVERSSVRATRRVGRLGAAMPVRASGAFGNNMRNLGFQINDFAVQVGAGTNASVALAQQLPQLLQGFGGLGIALSVVAAVGIPVVAAFRNMNSEGENALQIFGTLEPVFRAIGDGMRVAADIAVTFAELIINNLDRILITAGLVAGFFVGKWVAAFVAARIATFSLVGALTALRTALIRIGLGALIVAAGEVAYQFSRLIRAAGGFGEAMSLLKDVAREAFERIGAQVTLLKTSFQIVMNDIQYAWVNWLANLQRSFAEFVNSIARSKIGQSIGLEPISIEGIESARTSAMSGLTDALGGIMSERRGAQSLLDGPFKSIQAIRDLLASMKDEKITLPDILGLGTGDDEEGGGKSAAEKLDEELTAQEERVQEHFGRIKALTQGGLSDKLGAWGGYFKNLASLTGTNNKKLLGIAKSFAAAQALMDAWTAHNRVLADPTLPWYARIASAASVFAAGLGAVNAIKSISESGSTGGAASSGGGAGAGAGAASAEAAQPRPQTTLTFVGEYFSGEMIAGALNEFAQSGGRLDGDLIVRRA